MLLLLYKAFVLPHSLINAFTSQPICAFLLYRYAFTLPYMLYFFICSKALHFFMLYML